MWGGVWAVLVGRLSGWADVCLLMKRVLGCVCERSKLRKIRLQADARE